MSEKKLQRSFKLSAGAQLHFRDLYFRDIRAQKKAEEDLQESEHQFRAIFDLASVGIAQVDSRDGRIIRFNDKYREITGYTAEELRTKNFLELTHPDDRRQDWELFANAVRNKKPYYFNEKRYVRKDGSVVWVRINASFIRGKGGRPLRTVSVCEDITERKLADEALHRREQEFRALAENSPDIVARYDRNLRVLYVNPAIEKDRGVRREEIIGRSNEDLKMPADKLQLWNSTLQEVFLTGLENEIYFDYAAPGKRSYYHARIVPEFSPDGTVETVLAITRDITVIKAMEAALQREKARTRLLHLRSLPDDLPNIAGLAVAARFKPAVELRGDYYDLIRRNNQLLLYLVDIQDDVDDGVMHSFFVQKTLEECLHEREAPEKLSPAGLLAHLLAKSQEEPFHENYPFSLFIAVFEMEGLGTGSLLLRYISLGPYPSPLLLSAGGELRELNTEFPAPSAPCNATSRTDGLEEHTVEIAPGETVVFYTEGLLKQGAVGGYSRTERFQKVCGSRAHLPPELICQALDEEFNAVLDPSRRDDDTLLLVVQAPEIEHRLRFKVESRFEIVRETKDKVGSFLASFNGIQANLLSFHELLVNAIEHGNKRDGTKHVTIDVTATKRYYKISVTDQGEGFNWKSKIKRELELEGLSERGRGIVMTRMISDYLAYNKRGNRATMINLF